MLYGGVLGLAVVGVLSAGAWNVLPAESLLEGVFILTTAFCVARPNRAGRLMLVVALAYVALKTGLMVLRGNSPWLDFIQAYKAYFYLIALAFFVRRRIFSGPRLATVVMVLLSACLVKYGYSQVFGMDSRPGVYFENNYELIMIVGLFYLAWPYLGRRRALMLGVLTLVVLLSGSRSGALALLLLFVVLIVRRSNRFWPLHILGFGVVGVAVMTLFASRDPAGVQSIDRYNFLQIFLHEVQHWPLWEFLTGSYPITPLSPESCTALSYYDTLFSKTTPGVCYSVILHAYLMRGIFDQGVLGLGLLYVLVWMALRRSRASMRDAVLLLGILTISGTSVSAFNNVFAAIMLAVALGLDRGGDSRTVRGAATTAAPRVLPRYDLTPVGEAPLGDAPPGQAPPTDRQRSPVVAPAREADPSG